MNRLPLGQRVRMLETLNEGVSLRATARLLKCSNQSVKRFKRNMGRYCLDLHERTIRGVYPDQVQCDESWTLVHGREKARSLTWDERAGNNWIWSALVMNSRLCVAWLVGKRTIECADTFLRDVERRCVGDFTIVTDGCFSYPRAVREVFSQRPNVNHIVLSPTGRSQDAKHSTNHVERHNGKMRQNISAMRRNSNALAKSYDGLCDAVSLHMGLHNFIKIHPAHGTAPAVAAGCIDAPMMAEEMIIGMDEFIASHGEDIGIEEQEACIA